MKTKTKCDIKKSHVQLREELKKVTKQRQDEMTLLKHLVAQQKHY